MFTSNLKNTTETQPLTVINSLVRFSFRTTQPATTALNKGASRRLINDAKADKGSTRVHNKLLERKGTIIGKIGSLFNSTSKALRERALPDPTGGYYLKAADVPHVQQIFDTAQAKFSTLLAELMRVYDQIPRPALGAMAGEVYIPTACEFAARYSMVLDWSNKSTPISGTVLEGVSNETAARVRAESQKSEARNFKAAHAEPVRDAINVLSKSLKAVTTGKRLHQSALDKIDAAADRLKDMNWLDLPELRQLSAVLRPCAVDRGEIKTDADKESVAKRIKEAQRAANQTLSDLGV